MAQAQKKENGIWETIKTVFWALVIAGVFRTLFFQPFWIPSGSMKPTLLIGDFLFVNKMSYGYSYASCPSIVIPRLGVDLSADKLCGVFDGDNERILGKMPKSGDVVVFRHPTTGTDFVKRVIGLPGDTVQLKAGKLMINGAVMPTLDKGVFTEIKDQQGPMRLIPRCKNDPVGVGGSCEKTLIEETLPSGRPHLILDTTRQSSDETILFDVPEGHVFVMGDNRDNSSDSRYLQSVGGVGFVPYENLIGRADRIAFSSSGRSLMFFWTWRGDRFFKKIQ